MAALAVRLLRLCCTHAVSRALCPGVLHSQKACIMCMPYACCAGAVLVTASSAVLLLLYWLQQYRHAHDAVCIMRMHAPPVAMSPPCVPDRRCPFGTPLACSCWSYLPAERADWPSMARSWQPPCFVFCCEGMVRERWQNWPKKIRTGTLQAKLVPSGPKSDQNLQGTGDPLLGAAARSLSLFPYLTLLFFFYFTLLFSLLFPYLTLPFLTSGGCG